MENLSTEYPSYIDSIYFTTTGANNDLILDGKWVNFRESLSNIGTIMRAASGREILQISPLHRKSPGKVILEFSDVSKDITERISEAGRRKKPISIGVVRRYKVYIGNEDVLWIFDRVRDLVVSYSVRDSNARITFAGTLRETDLIGKL
jgi:hypothetical protein